MNRDSRRKTLDELKRERHTYIETIRAYRTLNNPTPESKANVRKALACIKQLSEGLRELEQLSEGLRRRTR
jgi:hypothetical protein